MANTNKNVIRLHVQDYFGRSSSVFRIWNSKNTSDVYFAHMNLASEMKGSLHQSGSWQYGLTSERLKTAKNIIGWDQNSRHIKRWNRPNWNDSGYFAAVKFILLTTELQILDEWNYDKSLKIDAAPENMGIMIQMIYAKEETKFESILNLDENKGYKLIGKLNLVSKEAVFLISKEIESNPLIESELQIKREEFKFMNDGSGRKARFAIINDDEDGTKIITEGAVVPEK